LVYEFQEARTPNGLEKISKRLSTFVRHCAEKEAAAKTAFDDWLLKSESKSPPDGGIGSVYAWNPAKETATVKSKVEIDFLFVQAKLQEPPLLSEGHELVQEYMATADWLSTFATFVQARAPIAIELNNDEKEEFDRLAACDVWSDFCDNSRPTMTLTHCKRWHI
jgi:hypothetical protein